MLCSRCKYSDVCPEAFQPIAQYCSAENCLDEDRDGRNEAEEFDTDEEDS